eukprot:gene11917-3525_t
MSQPGYMRSRGGVPVRGVKRTLGDTSNKEAGGPGAK